MNTQISFPRAVSWAFRSDFDKQRRFELENSPAFDEIVERICKEAASRKIDAPVRPGNRAELFGCHRAGFCLRVKPTTFDIFFNSPTGLRAQYLVHPDLGQAANCVLIAALRLQLLDAYKNESLPIAHKNWSIDNSIDATSARIWRYELVSTAPKHDLNIPGWDGHGSSAPMGECLVVNGAWIDSDGQEVVIPEKIGRRFEVHRSGYS